MTFRSKRLEACYLSLAKGTRAWGEAAARKYVQRLDILKAAGSLADLRAFPSLRCHPLKGARQGQHAIALTERRRLIFTVESEDPLTVCIEEVSQHYGD